jgi:quercetin dioxygenase-like cupin family protein
MQFPQTISNIHGESITFLRLVKTDKGDVIELENELKPKAGPPMHVHWLQDEGLKVTEGKMAYQTLGGKVQYASPGESVTFLRGTPHKFWNAGTGILRCTGWVTPPNNVIYFLTEVYKSANENGGRPGAFDSAYLLKRYKSEFAMYEVPGFVQKVIFPIALFFGKIAGKHKKFRDAPMPIK